MKSDVGIGASSTAAAMARTLKDRRTAPGKTPPKNKLAAKRIAKKSGQPPPAEVRKELRGHVHMTSALRGREGVG